MIYNYLMKKTLRIAIPFVLLIIITVSVMIFVLTKDSSDEKSSPNVDLPGEVIGPNPNNIPENQLPHCQPGAAGGISSTPQPCYSPPDAVYM